MLKKRLTNANLPLVSSAQQSCSPRFSIFFANSCDPDTSGFPTIRSNS